MTIPPLTGAPRRFRAALHSFSVPIRGFRPRLALLAGAALLAGCAAISGGGAGPFSPAVVISSPPSAGDTWVYEFVDFWKPADRRRIRHTAVSSGAGAVEEVLAYESGVPNASESHVRFSRRPEFVEYGMGDIALHEFAPYLASFEALRSGQSWQHIPGMPMMNSTVMWELNGVAHGLEEVTVQAGRFQALRVELRAWRGATGRRDVAPVTARMGLWYSPGVKRVVLVTFESFDKRGMGWDRERQELVSFKVR